MATGFINGAVSVDDAPTSRTNLGLGSMSVENIDSISAAMVPVGDRAQNLGSSSNSWDVAYVDGVSFDDGTNTLANYTASTTFTPSLEFGGATTGITYTTQAGRYCRVGSIVYFSIYLLLSSKGTATGTATITGLPFTVNITSSVTHCVYSNVTVPAGRTDIAFFPANVQTYGTLYGYGTGTTISALNDTHFAATSSVYITGCYVTNAA